MIENEGTESYSTDKYESFLSATDEHTSNIKRCAEIIYQLETDSDLSLSDKDLLKTELGEKVDSIKTNSQDIIDTLVTEYQLYDATAPRITTNLSGFKMIEEKVVNKNRDYRLNRDEAENDAAFYYSDID
ncbi:hypothetical protein M4L90_12410 [Staphylococcus equorum]|uniref:Uncharacterized protein n=1 Tax=Staphylococcus equorum TaxID=246432 RepID=A0A9X4QZX2_9STAP|nr:hypothetical protein [Staphylococcus equorum]MDG0820723.1 hypothetical protein [Staphylococcus equorum]MDG0841348.1 hypothetical protein [Staphylococcus equorum]MDG0847048.1 hypothetical protein [Staphylococcus equorum]PTE82323.1 hypothetical protein BUY85_00875 [Staphylococcus equorum]